MIRSYVILALLFALSAMIVLGSVNVLLDVNTLLVSLRRPLTLQEYYSTKDVLNDDEISVFCRYENMDVSVKARSLAGVSIYGCDGKFGRFSNIKLIHGRFLWDSDVTDKKALAVIDENVAVALFSRTECVGEPICILGKEYSVAGVCKGSEGLWDAWTGVDKYAVYIPYDYNPALQSSGGILLSSGNPSLLEPRAMLLGPLYYVSVIDNLAMRARMISLVGRFSLLFVWLLAFVACLRVTYRYSKVKLPEILADLNNRFYFKDYIVKNIIWILLHLIIALVIVIAFFFWYKAVSFRLEVDPKLLPVPLNDLNGWKENLITYFLSYNTKVTVPYRNAILIEKMKWIITAASVSMLISANSLIRKIYHFFTDKMLNNTPFSS